MMPTQGSSLAQLIRASRGPVLLITLGFLLALHQASRLSFNQTFPVLIIVFGILWLLERMMPRPIHVDSFPPPLPNVAAEDFYASRETPRTGGPQL